MSSSNGDFVIVRGEDPERQQVERAIGEAQRMAEEHRRRVQVIWQNGTAWTGLAWVWPSRQVDLTADGSRFV